MFEKLKEKLPFFKEHKQYQIQKAKEKLVQEKLMEVISNSYYDENTNTLVVNTPTNLILKSSGSMMQVAEEGFIVQMADQIHLNPEMSERTKVNIKNLGKQFDDVVEPLTKTLEG